MARDQIHRYRPFYTYKDLHSKYLLDLVLLLGRNRVQDLLNNSRALAHKLVNVALQLRQSRRCGEMDSSSLCVVSFVSSNSASLSPALRR